MNPRMEKLLRQRALVQEHLRWLEGEIAAESGSKLSPPDPQQESANPRAANPTPEVRAAELSEPNVRGIHSEVRTGCLLYFGLACLALGLIVAFIYWRY